MDQPTEPQGKTYMEAKLRRLVALYDMHGRDGLRQESLADVNLLLQSKEMTLKSMPPTRDLMEPQRSAAHHLALEVSDLRAYVDSRLALVSSPGLRVVRGFGGQTQQQQPWRQRGYQKRNIEHER